MAVSPKKKVTKKKPARKKKIVKKKTVKRKAAPKKKVQPKPETKGITRKQRSRIGRPSPYKPEYGHFAKVLCKHGATDAGLAEAFGVTERTINAWKKAHSEDFLQPIKIGKDEANEHVKQALYSRACGYSHKDTKFASHEGVITDYEEYTKHYPPDTAACVFFLCNRDPENWKRNGDEGGATDNDLAQAFAKLALMIPD